jgi:16S rRNA (adenine1518-N6/adenine1519-N6)-dimethyltransferase
MSFEHKKSLGQYFLNNTRVPHDMVEAAHVTKRDVVLEVGPGTGALTEALLATGARVIALEADMRAITFLKERFPSQIASGHLLLIHGDIREMSIEHLSPHIHNGAYKVVANIPYYLSGMLFRIFLESRAQPETLVFLIQKEVAERIARDKKESLLSLSVKVYGTPRYVKTVKRGNFTPQPRVDSAILAVDDISRERLKNLRDATFFDIVHAGMGKKRKQLVSNLCALASRDTLLDIFAACDIPPRARGEDVSLTTWVALAHALDAHTNGSYR